MDTFRVKKCCFFIDLRTAALVMGYMGAIGFAILAILYLIFTFEAIAAADPGNGGLNVVAILAFVVPIIFLLAVAVNFGFYLALLVGVYQKSLQHIRAYSIFGLIFMVVTAINLVHSAFGSAEKATNITLSLFILVWTVYTEIVVHSYYLELNAELQGRSLLS